MAGIELIASRCHPEYDECIASIEEKLT